VKAQAAIRNHLDREAMLSKEFAFLIGVTPTTLTKWMSGRHAPQKPLRKKIGEIVGVNVNKESDWIPREGGEGK